MHIASMVRATFLLHVLPSVLRTDGCRLVRWPRCRAPDPARWLFQLCPQTATCCGAAPTTLCVSRPSTCHAAHACTAWWHMCIS